MTSITAIVRNGRLETAQPINLPDGTELTIPVPNGTPVDADAWDTSPDCIAAWVAWSSSLEPLIDWEETEAYSQQCDRHEAEKQNRDVEELFR